jgi:hypothetical protein
MTPEVKELIYVPNSGFISGSFFDFPVLHALKITITAVKVTIN